MPSIGRLSRSRPSAKYPPSSESTQKSTLNRRFSSSARASSLVASGSSPASVAQCARAMSAAYTYPWTSHSAIGVAASVPSAKRIESQESFHPWFCRPRSVVRWYSTYPSPSLSPWSVIHSSARSAAGSNASTSARPFPPPASSPNSITNTGAPPARELADEHHEQRRRVGGAVVDAAAAQRE